MKKIIIVLIGFILITSCRSKKRLTNKKTVVTKRVVKDTKKINDVKVIETSDSKKTEPVKNQENTVVIKETIPVTNLSVLVDDLYQRKPHLQSKKIDYIKNYSAIAIHEMEKYKIPASITLAQGLLESRYGESFLTKSSNNHFGIKCHKNWTGQRVFHDDDAKGECFRKYNYPDESYRDHSLFLANKKRYKKLFTYKIYDYKSWAKGLRKAGYATDKKYPKKLIKLIEDYELYMFDKLVLGTDYKETHHSNTILVKNNSTVKEHIVKAQETLYTISGIYYISVEDLKRYNNLSSNMISVGQVIKLQKPIKSFSQKESNTHAVVKGDTIFSISKKYNITIKQLKNLNDLKSDNIAIGQKLIID
ncbi:MAG: glucosaminidase domain-containing protein [Flavobacteriaceae bacterium]